MQLQPKMPGPRPRTDDIPTCPLFAVRQGGGIVGNACSVASWTAISGHSPARFGYRRLLILLSSEVRVGASHGTVNASSSSKKRVIAAAPTTCMQRRVQIGPALDKGVTAQNVLGDSYRRVSTLRLAGRFLGQTRRALSNGCRCWRRAASCPATEERPLTPWHHKNVLMHERVMDE